MKNESEKWAGLLQEWSPFTPNDQDEEDQHSFWLPHTSEWGEQQIEAQCESLEATSGNLRTLLFILIMLEIMLRMMMMVSDYDDNYDYCSSTYRKLQNKNSASKWSNMKWTPSPPIWRIFSSQVRGSTPQEKRTLDFLSLLTLFGLVWQWCHLKADLCTIDAKKGEKNASKHSSFNTLESMSSQLLLNYFPRISHLSCV